MIEVEIYPQAINANSLALMRAWLIHMGHRENATSWVAIDNIGPLLVIGNTESQWESPTYLPEWATSKVVLKHAQWEQALLAENKATDRSQLLVDIEMPPAELPDFEDFQQAVRFLLNHCPCEQAIADQADVCLRNHTKDFPVAVRQAAEVLLRKHRFVNLNAVAVTNELRSKIPADLIATYGVIAFATQHNEIHVATKQPSRMLADKIRSRIGMEAVQYIAPVSAIDDAVARTANIGKELKRTGNTGASVRSVSLTIDPNDVNADISESVDGHMILSHVIAQAIIQRANDIHIQPESANQTMIRFRIDRDLRVFAILNAEQSERLFGRIKAVAEMKPGMHLQMDDAAMTVMFNNEEYDLRLGNIPVKGGYMAPQPSPCVTIRVLAKQYKFQGLEDLGFSERDRLIIRAAVKQPVGMILVAGATSSGKSTTVFGMLNEVKSEANSVMSIEDPVEYFQTLVKQTQVSEVNEITPESYIPKALRHNPNVIYAGETRDSAVARAGIAATSSGHLYFSTIHANSATAAINRMTGVYGIAGALLSDYLQLVIFQALVRKPCPRAMRMRRIGDLPDKEEILYEFSRHFPNRTIVTSDSEICDIEPRDGETGFRGETLVAEALPISNVLRELIERGVSERELRNAALEEGFWTIQQDALLKVRRGIITFSEFRRLGNPMWVEDLALKTFNETVL